MSVPSLPPDTFPSPEGPFTLSQPHFPASFLAAPLPSNHYSSTTAASSYVGGAMGGFIPVPVSMSSSTAMGTSMGTSALAASASALSAAGPVGVGGPGNLVGTSGVSTSGQGSGGGVGAGGMTSPQAAPPGTPAANITAPTWPVKITWVPVIITPSNGSGGKVGGVGEKIGGLGGFLSRGGGGMDKGNQNQNQNYASQDQQGTSYGKDGKDRERSNSNGLLDYEPSLQSSDNSNPTPEHQNNNNNKDYGGGNSLGISVPPSTTMPGMGNQGISSSLRSGSMMGISLSKPIPNNKARQIPRPKNSIRATSSTFITRVQTHDSFQKLLVNPHYLNPDGGNSSAPSPIQTRWAFVNTFKSLCWCLIDPTGKIKDPMMRISFGSILTSHTSCEQLKINPGYGPGGGGDTGRLDLMLGFHSGDLIWLDPILGKYSRLNKSGVIHSSPVMQIRYHPFNSSLIYVLHADGLLFTYSTEREDPSASAFVGGNQTTPWNTALKKWNEEFNDGDGGGDDDRSGFDTVEKEIRKERSRGKDADRVFVWKNDDVFGSTTTTGGIGGGGVGGGKQSKESSQNPWVGKNPIQVTKLDQKGINAFEFSPDGLVIACTSLSGLLKIYDPSRDTILDTYASYFGGLNCLTWSPDGRYVLIGGQDDLVTIVCPRESRVVGRCQGHGSYVRDLAFDGKRCNARGYRFGSVGEDGRVIFWDFSSASLHRPRHAHHGPSTGSNRRLSISSTLSTAAQAKLSAAAAAGAGNASIIDQVDERYHPAPRRDEVAMLQPVAVALTESYILNAITFFPDALVTVNRMGSVRFWLRPTENRNLAGSSTGNEGTRELKDKMRGMKVGGEEVKDSRRSVRA